MATLEELQAEAAELYPNAPGRMFNGEPFPRFEQQAHVRAKKITAKQVEAACRGFYEDPSGLTNWERLCEVNPEIAENYRNSMTRALRAAGFYVEGGE